MRKITTREQENKEINNACQQLQNILIASINIPQKINKRKKYLIKWDNPIAPKNIQLSDI